ncbi:MAG: aspartate kinase [Vulcanisaeta sp.]|uniref:amino acid kinase family protein n=1 Tax=Vulcanisaeta sp. TaxID=2020871 RepID=UPI003D133F59
MGGSLLTRKSVLNTISRVIERDFHGNKLILVVSAMKGVTDMLIRALDERNPQLIDKAVQVYIDEAIDLGLDRLAKFLGFIGEDLRRFVSVGEPWIRDHVIIHGELLSTLLVSEVLSGIMGINAKAVYEPGIVTNQEWGNASVIDELSLKNVREKYMRLLGKYDIIVTPGFLGVSMDGRYTSLGRGGSDYTASLIASYLNASRLTFYTDSGGVLSGDPKIVEDPILIKEISYEEAHAASKVGAKKFHPKTFEPLMKSRVLALITSPQLDSGTYITNNCIRVPKVVSVGKINQGLYRVSIVGCGISLNNEVIKDLSEVVSPYGIDGIVNDDVHVISMLVNDGDSAIDLTRDVHRWVRKWIG